MKRRLAVLLWAFSVAGAAVVPAPASERGSGSIGPRMMRFEAKDSDEANWNVGAQLRFNLTPVVALEGSVDYRQDDFGPVDLYVYPVQASLLFYLTEAPVSPFLLGGAGWYFTTIEAPGLPDRTDDRFGLHAGAGLQFMLGEYWSIDGAYRYVWLEEFRSRDAALQDKEFDDSGHMITAALNYHF
jgi:opacity protein-like surface antigen